MSIRRITALILIVMLVFTASACHKRKKADGPVDLSSRAKALEAEKPVKVTQPTELYVKIAGNLYKTSDDIALGGFVDYGTKLSILGYDRADTAGNVHMWHVTDGTTDGWIRNRYVAATQEEAKRPEVEYEEQVVGTVSDTDSTPKTELVAKDYPIGSIEYYYSFHETRPDKYGGGDAASLDYYPREAFTPLKESPEVCKTLYIPGNSKATAKYRQFLEVAGSSDINAFVVDITDNTCVGFPAETMEKMCPSAAAAASNTKEYYAEVIKALKDSGYYVIGRITTFNDGYLCQDHPEWGIVDQNGKLKAISKTYWPSAYNRNVWEYKVRLAMEAAQTYGFDEIQFDYVRFPDRTQTMEANGELDFRNEYGETKAQAITRFLQYATDCLHDIGVSVSADVFGETANAYVAPHGQYWPAISNTVDYISAMPYCDHYAADGDWYPWEHPYDILTTFGTAAYKRQQEVPTPARVRTWIQCYDSIRAPKVIYDAEHVSQEINALYDAGLCGGFITWNANADTEKYMGLRPAFDIDPDEKQMRKYDLLYR